MPTRPSAGASGSATPAVLDQPESASAGRPVGGGSPAHDEGRVSPSPSSDAASPGATPVRTGSGRRDTRTTRASSPPTTTARAPNLASPTTPGRTRTSLRTLRGDPNTDPGAERE